MTEYQNLIGGVSQQAPLLRFPNQCEVADNMVPSVVEGMIRRRPTEHINKLPSAPLADNVACHVIDRDATERYLVVADSSSVSGTDCIKVWDLDGNEKAVKGPDGVTDLVGLDVAYLAGTDPQENFQFLTIQDYTIVLNRQRRALRKTDLTRSDFENHGLVFVKQGNYSTKYEIEAEWVQSATTYTSTVQKWTLSSNGKYSAEAQAALSVGAGSGTVAEAEDDIKTENICEDLIQALMNPVVTGAGTIRTGGSDMSAHFTVSQATDQNGEPIGSVIWFDADPSVESLKIRVSDSQSGNSIGSIVDNVGRLSDLPTSAPDGFYVEIDDDPESPTGSYWVEFSTYEGETFAEGSWQESVAPDEEYAIEPYTMPHLLIRMSDGNFMFAPADGGSGNGVTRPQWDDRTVGSVESNPWPSFIADSSGEGPTLRGIFYYADRLGILTGESVVLSEVGQYFNFFRNTVVTLLDSDRIDNTVPHTEPANLNWATPSSELLILWSDRNQFVAPGGAELITPKTFTTRAVSEFENSTTVQPVSLGSSVMFTGQRGAYGALKELVDVSTNRPRFEAPDLSATVPSYISGQIIKIAHSTLENTVAILTKGADSKNQIWVYSFFQNGGERVQSAWSRLILPQTYGVFPAGDTEIYHIDFVDSVLYLYCKRGTDRTLERMCFEPLRTDEDSTWLVHLDRKIDESACSSVTYSAVTESTTFTLPYDIQGNVQVVSRATSSVEPGTVYKILSTGTDTVEVDGDLSSAPVWIGETYESVFEPSEVHPLDPRTGVLRRVDRYDLQDARFDYELSGAFYADVIAPDGTTYTNTMGGGDYGDSVLGEALISSGSFRFPIRQPNRKTRIVFRTENATPMRLLTGEVRGITTRRGRGA